MASSPQCYNLLWLFKWRKNQTHPSVSTYVITLCKNSATFPIGVIMVTHKHINTHTHQLAPFGCPWCTLPESIVKTTPYREWSCRVCHNFSRSLFLYLFGQRSTAGVAGLLAVIDPLFIFHLSCLLTCLVSISLITCCVFNTPPCLCAELFNISACARFALLRLTSLPPVTHSLTE
jgi:hypothetical protein